MGSTGLRGLMDFEKSIEYVLENEGGFVDDPRDNGKATNFGITEVVLSVFRNKASGSDDIKNLTMTEAKEIYKRFYWSVLKLDQVPDPICTAILDMSVNFGGSTSIKLTQKALGFIEIDGLIGPKTIGSLLTVNPKDFIFKLVSVMQDRYVDLVTGHPDQVVFLKGWLARARKLLTLT